MKILASFLLVVIMGCTYHPIPYSVFRQDGNKFTAPDLCQALTACLNSDKNQSCFYHQTIITTADGMTEKDYCKKVGGK